MTKNEAKLEVEKIINELIEVEEKIIKKAKEQGRWEQGLDTNDHLFVAINNEAKMKIAEVIKRIDKE